MLTFSLYERESLSHTEREAGNQLNTDSVYESFSYRERGSSLSLSLSRPLSLYERERERSLSLKQQCLLETIENSLSEPTRDSCTGYCWGSIIYHSLVFDQFCAFHILIVTNMF